MKVPGTGNILRPAVEYIYIPSKMDRIRASHFCVDMIIEL